MRTPSLGRALAALALCLASGPAPALRPDEILGDPALETRARDLGKQLRCLVCQNQSIDDSEADLARDLRRIVRERLSDGASDRDVLAFVVARYGDYVLLNPPVKATTWALWFGPPAILGLGIVGMAVYLRRRSRAPSVAADPLSPAEQSRLAAILRRDGSAADGG
jgi:cytochrome c-type biogenesis protein CcmH